MKILVDIGHPAHVHFFRYIVEQLQKNGHQVLIMARTKAHVIELLEFFGLEHIVASKNSDGGFLSLLRMFLSHSLKIIAVSRQFRPDVIMSISSPMAAWASAIMRIPHITFDDTEHAKLEHALYRPWSKRIYTPTSFTKHMGRKQFRYAGFHELAYLHPNRFTPDVAVLAQAGLQAGEPFFVMRTVSWEAAHDVGHHGLSQADVHNLRQMLERHGKVVLSDETKSRIEIGATQLHPNQMHDLLYYATLYIGEGGTMATEAALLGTPSILVNTLTAGNWDELENKYSLMYSFKTGAPAIAKAEELLANPNLKAEWQEKRARLLRDKIDVTQFVVDEIEKFS